jgi:hypothetical protein
MTSSLELALNWINAALLGSIGTVVAILAIAGLGLAMLQGRIPARRGAVTVIGCFILFSSASVATALVGVSTQPIEEVTVPLVAPPAYAAPIPPPVPYDPYAGASVPERAQDRARGLLPQ